MSSFIPDGYITFKAALERVIQHRFRDRKPPSRVERNGKPVPFVQVLEDHQSELKRLAFADLRQAGFGGKLVGRVLCYEHGFDGFVDIPATAWGSDDADHWLLNPASFRAINYAGVSPLIRGHIFYDDAAFAAWLTPSPTKTADTELQTGMNPDIRAAGVRSIRDRARNRQNLLEKMIRDVLDNPTKPGWTKTKPEILKIFTAAGNTYSDRKTWETFLRIKREYESSSALISAD